MIESSDEAAHGNGANFGLEPGISDSGLVFDPLLLGYLCVVVSWMWTPLLFTPRGLHLATLRKDLREWLFWMNSRDLTSPQASWEVQEQG